MFSVSHLAHLCFKPKFSLAELIVLVALYVAYDSFVDHLVLYVFVALVAYFAVSFAKSKFYDVATDVLTLSMRYYKGRK